MTANSVMVECLIGPDSQGMYVNTEVDVGYSKTCESKSCICSNHNDYVSEALARVAESANPDMHLAPILAEGKAEQEAEEIVITVLIILFALATAYCCLKLYRRYRRRGEHRIRDVARVDRQKRESARVLV